jgi:hypothetical protein
MNLQKEQFFELIKTSIHQKPQWLETAIQAINAGITEAFEDLTRKAADLDSAFLCALGLLDTKRLTDELKQYLNSVIVDKIKAQKYKSPVEDKFLSKHTEKKNETIGTNQAATGDLK